MLPPTSTATSLTMSSHHLGRHRVRTLSRGEVHIGASLKRAILVYQSGEGSGESGALWNPLGLKTFLAELNDRNSKSAGRSRSSSSSSCSSSSSSSSSSRCGVAILVCHAPDSFVSPFFFFIFLLPLPANGMGEGWGPGRGVTPAQDNLLPQPAMLGGRLHLKKTGTQHNKAGG